MMRLVMQASPQHRIVDKPGAPGNPTGVDQKEYRICWCD